jgi:hypothetical protein
LGLLLSGLSAEAIVSLLSKRRLLVGLTKAQLFFIKVIIFIIGLTISYLAVAYLFRDLYVM